MFSEWLEIGSSSSAGNLLYEAIFLKKSSALHPGRECACYVRKILGFHEWLLEALFFGSQCRTLDGHISITGDSMKS